MNTTSYTIDYTRYTPDLTQLKSGTAILEQPLRVARIRYNPRGRIPLTSTAVIRGMCPMGDSDIFLYQGKRWGAKTLMAQLHRQGVSCYNIKNKARVKRVVAWEEA